MSEDFRLIMLSAMYENGGNTTHRLLDGHPQLFTYPFESQLGTKLVRDHLESLFPVKYRWPAFDLACDASGDYEAIIDEECKVRSKTPDVSKFRKRAFALQDGDRKASFLRHVGEGPRTRGRIVEAFFRATFDAWKDVRRSGRESTYVGYSPVVVVDAEKILADLPGSHVVHVVRNPWSAYADTKKRAVPLSLEHYMAGWTTCQQYALLYHGLYPSRVHLLRYEDIIVCPEETLGRLLQSIGLEPSPSLGWPSWNGSPLETVRPWGTIRIPTPEVNIATSGELSDQERSAIEQRAWPYLAPLGYDLLLDGPEGSPLLP
jgi:hypothetical protein